jgi:uncharacterized protein (TIGR03790 family)
MFAALAGLLAFGLAATARAGGGPENLLLVVNPESAASLTIANHYARLRRIPASNVFYLPWNPKVDSTDIDTFRQRILKPVVDAALDRRPRGQIDYVVYSSDFPWGVRLDSDRKKFDDDAQKARQAKADKEGNPADAGPPAWVKVLTPVGSLTGLTYLWEPVVAGHSSYLGLRNNLYVPTSAEQKDLSTAFSSSRHFGVKADAPGSRGIHYLLSVMLGVTAGRGNSVAEVLEYLRRSAAADGTHPSGTIYYCQNGDIRSRVRQDGFLGAVRALKSLGVQAEIIEGTIPQHKNDVQGAMIGAASFDWKSSGSTILPGAICEHFTSFGGMMSAGAGQTPLSELLRYGAAGASGTVTEPYAIANKFPDPMVQVHYARGCTLAEAFYQSVRGPYQLLIVGDPLCRPWADIPQVSVAGVQAGATVQGPLALRPTAVPAGKNGVDHFELFVDGLRLTSCVPGGTLKLDTNLLADGAHELRVVAIEAGAIRSQGRQILPVITANHQRTIDVSCTPPHAVGAGQSLAVTVKAPGSANIVIFQGSRVVGKIAGAQGHVDIDSATLGSGPVQLQTIGLGQGLRNNVWARPLEVEVGG